MHKYRCTNCGCAIIYGLVRNIWWVTVLYVIIVTLESLPQKLKAFIAIIFGPLVKIKFDLTTPFTKGEQDWNTIVYDNVIPD